MKTKYSITNILIMIGIIVLSGFIVQGVVPIQESGIMIWLGLFLTPIAITFIIMWLTFGNPFAFIQAEEKERSWESPKESLKKAEQMFKDGNWK